KFVPTRAVRAICRLCPVSLWSGRYAEGGDAMPTLMTAAMAFAGEINYARRPNDVLNLLDRRIATKVPGLRIMHAWQTQRVPDDWSSYTIDENIFSHPSVPDAFWSEFFAGIPSHGLTPLARMAWRARDPFTFTECMRSEEPAGRDRWIFDLLAKHGIRDGFYCPVGGWNIIFWSPRILKLSAEERYFVYIAAGRAASRLEELRVQRERRRQQKKSG